MDPLIRCIYPDCNKVFDFSIEKFISSSLPDDLD